MRLFSGELTIDYDNSSQDKNGWAEGQSKFTVGDFFPFFFSFGIVTMHFFQFLFKEGGSPIA